MALSLLLDFFSALSSGEEVASVASFSASLPSVSAAVLRRVGGLSVRTGRGPCSHRRGAGEAGDAADSARTMPVRPVSAITRAIARNRVAAEPVAGRFGIVEFSPLCCVSVDIRRRQYEQTRGQNRVMGVLDLGKGPVRRSNSKEIATIPSMLDLGSEHISARRRTTGSVKFHGHMSYASDFSSRETRPI